MKYELWLESKIQLKNAKKREREREFGIRNGNK